MRILVIGGTGTVGRSVVAALVARGQAPLVLTRTAEKISMLAAGAVGVLGDLMNPPTLLAAMEGCEAVFMVNALSPSEAHEGLVAVACAAQSGVGRFVYLSAFNLDRSMSIPHFGAKGAIEAALRVAAHERHLRFVVLRPNHFFQNDMYAKSPLVRGGIYPEPLGEAGVSRIDVRDIADAAANALLANGTSDFDGHVFELSGSQILRASDVAACWAAGLSKPVRAGDSDLDKWQQQMARFLPPWQLFDLRRMYETYHRGEAIASSLSLQRQATLVGHAPRQFDDYVRETAALWRAG